MLITFSFPKRRTCKFIIGTRGSTPDESMRRNLHAFYIRNCFFGAAFAKKHGTKSARAHTHTSSSEKDNAHCWDSTFVVDMLDLILVPPNFSLPWGPSP